MARYSISFHDRNNPGPQVYEIGAANEAEARVRFLNLTWVSFQPIYIVSVALIGGTPVERPPPKRRKRPKPPGIGKDNSGDIDRLSEEIRALTEAAQERVRQGDHDGARALRARAKALQNKQFQLIRRRKK